MNAHKQPIKPGIPYMPKVLEIAKALASVGPGISHINVYHDDWCDLLNRKGQCNCNPTVESGEQRIIPKN